MKTSQCLGCAQDALASSDLMEVRRVCALDRNSLDPTLRVFAAEDPPDITYVLFARSVTSPIHSDSDIGVVKVTVSVAHGPRLLPIPSAGCSCLAQCQSARFPVTTPLAQLAQLTHTHNPQPTRPAQQICTCHRRIHRQTRNCCVSSAAFAGLFKHERHPRILHPSASLEQPPLSHQEQYVYRPPALQCRPLRHLPLPRSLRLPVGHDRSQAKSRR
jgi:hypothetical protein